MTQPSHSPLEPIDDFGHHHTLVHVLLAVDALGQRVEELAAAGRSEAAAHGHQPDDFAHALLGLAALRENLRAVT